MTSQPAIHCRPVETHDLDAIASFETFTSCAPWDKAQLAERLSHGDTLGYCAEIEGKTAGYIIYQHDDTHHQNSILKFAVTPAFQAQAEEIREALLDVVRQDMSQQGRNHIVVYTSTADEDTVDFFRQKHDEFKHFKAAGTDHVMIIYEMPPSPTASPFPTSAPQDTSSFLSFPSLDTGTSISPPTAAFMQSDAQPFGTFTCDTGMDLSGLEFSSLDSSIDAYPYAQQEEHAPAVTPRRLSPAVLALRAKEKLTELTGMEWEAVTLGKRGKLTSVLPSENSMDDLCFRTANKVENPRQAMEAVCRFLGEKPPSLHTAKLDRPAQLAIPASWVRPVHLTLGKPGMLAQDVKPAATQLRYRLPEEDGPRKASGGRG